MTVITSGRDDQQQKQGDHGGQPGQTGGRELPTRMLHPGFAYKVGSHNSDGAPPPRRLAGRMPALRGSTDFFCKALHPLVILVALTTLLLAGCATTHQPILDLKITNGRILDGTGAPWFRGDVGVRGDTIVAVGDLAAQPAASTIDAHGRIVSPGFIDLLGQSQFGTFASRCGSAKTPNCDCPRRSM